MISVLIISALAVFIVSSAVLFSISESDMALQEDQAWQAFYLANLCAEQALMKVESVLAYAGNEVISTAEGSCSILAIEGNGNFSRVIKTQSTVSKQTRKVKVEIYRISPVLQITSWQQVADF